MAKKTTKGPKTSGRKKQQHRKNVRVEDYIESLYMNGLHGRMLRMPAPAGKNREILWVYGHHSTLERWWGMIQNLNQFGAVTAPDLPGFGGMDSLYKIGQKPDIDALADYLAAFVKLRYKRRRITIVGLSFGFVVVTRMLQRYPDIAKKVDLLVSVVGFSHHQDFTFSKTRMSFYKAATALFAHRAPALLFKNVMIHPFLLRAIYARTHNAKDKFRGADSKKHKELMDFEVYLWHTNDVRTHMFTSLEFLRLDNCKQRVNLPVWHVSVKADRYFDNDVVEQHLNVIFKEVHTAKSHLDSHAPSVIASVEEAAQIIPAKLRRILEKD